MEHGEENRAYPAAVWEDGQVLQAEHNLCVLLGVVLLLLSLVHAVFNCMPSSAAQCDVPKPYLCNLC